MQQARRDTEPVFHTGQMGEALNQLRDCGIDFGPLLGALVGNPVAIERFCGDLLPYVAAHQSAAKERDRGRATKNKVRGGAAASNQNMGLVRAEHHLPRSVVGFLVSELIEACCRTRTAPPAALAQL